MLEVPRCDSMPDFPFRRNQLRFISHLLSVRKYAKGFNDFLSLISQGSLFQRRKKGTEKQVNHSRSHNKRERKLGPELRRPADRESKGDEKEGLEGVAAAGSTLLPEPFQDLGPLGFPYKSFLGPWLPSGELLSKLSPFFLVYFTWVSYLYWAWKIENILICCGNNGLVALNPTIEHAEPRKTPCRAPIPWGENP